MKLTKEFLDQVSWYEYKHDYRGGIFYDSIIFHFKKWYKKNISIDIGQVSRFNPKDETTEWSSRLEYIELKEQLNKYFHE